MKEREWPSLFHPEREKVYQNRGGGRYRCVMPISLGRAIMINILSNWIFTAVGLRRYTDGAIEWDFSTDGRFLQKQ